MQCVIESAGSIVTSATEPCPGWVLLTPAEAGNVVGQITAETLATIGITAESLATSYIAGFGFVGVVTTIGWAIAIATGMIRKV